jgi:hypothetical protein
MKTNATILAGAKAKFTKPDFEIEQATIPFGSYYEPYGSLYLPIPKPVFPVGATLEFGVWWNAESGQMTDEVGLPFKIEIDDPDFDPISDDVSVDIFVSGDKLWREEILAMEYNRELIEDPLENPYRYDTAQYLKIKQVGWEPLMTPLELVQYLNTERFWRCRLKKTVGETTYYSAMSDIVSFKIKFKRAEDVDLTEGGYPGDGAVPNERGIWFDGTFYYIEQEEGGGV